MRKNLNGIKILITAGSTWVAIDKVRVITNIFKGGTGYRIATMAAKKGADVTLLIGKSLNITNNKINSKIKIINYKYFDDLDDLMSNLLLNNKFDVVVHSAAVSDFKLDRVYNGKIKSNTSELILRLIPTKKIVDYIKKINPKVYLVKFKLEVGISLKRLETVAYNSLVKSNADLIVANLYNENFIQHEALVIDKENNITKVVGKDDIAKEIFKNLCLHVK